MGQIDSKHLTNISIVVVRYFGGTLLGTPGLINAYRCAAAMALQLIPIFQKSVTSQIEINFDYTQMNEVLRGLKVFNCEVIIQEMQLFCRIVVNVPKTNVHELKQWMGDIRGVELKKPVHRVKKI